MYASYTEHASQSLASIKLHLMGQVIHCIAISLEQKQCASWSISSSPAEEGGNSSIASSYQCPT